MYDISTWGPREPFGSLGELAIRLGRRVRVAVARFDNLGDVFMTTPALLALRDSESVESVVLIARSDVAPIFGSSDLDVISSKIPDFFKEFPQPRYRQRQLDAFAEGYALARGQFDLIVCPRWDNDWGHSRAWAAGAHALIAGLDYGSPARDAANANLAELELATSNQILSLSYRDERIAVHEAARAQALVTALGVEIGGRHVARKLFGDIPPTAPGRLVAHTTATSGRREWPVEAWIRLLRRAHELGITETILVGGPDDAARHLEITSVCSGVRSVAGAPLSDLPRIVGSAELVIASDSGPAHVSGGLDVPTVVISPHHLGADDRHMNSPVRFAPIGAAVDVVRPPTPAGPGCDQGCEAHAAHCILGVSVNEVIAAAKGLLARARAAA